MASRPEQTGDEVGNCQSAHKGRVGVRGWRGGCSALVSGRGELKDIHKGEESKRPGRCQASGPISTLRLSFEVAGFLTPCNVARLRWLASVVKFSVSAGSAKAKPLQPPRS